MWAMACVRRRALAVHCMTQEDEEEDDSTALGEDDSSVGHVEASAVGHVRGPRAYLYRCLRVRTCHATARFAFSTQDMDSDF